MSYLEFHKEALVNLEYSLHREILSTNRAGAYMSTTIVCCNTRKYHGLLIVPVKEFDNKRFVLLSSLDETIIQHDQAFNFGIHRYPKGVHEPRGHKYIVDFKYDPAPTIEYRVGGVHLRKELLMTHNEDQVLIRYTLLDAHSNTVLRLKPYLAFRNTHQLSKENTNADVHLQQLENGISSKMYADLPTLCMQLNKKNEFVAAPDWYCNVEYLEEQKRGYEFNEDLLVPGFFEVPIKRGESIVFSASLKDVPSTGDLAKKFDAELAKRSEKKSFRTCLEHAADQFIVRRGDITQVEAGFPWYGRRTRDTFVALPGITLFANSTNNGTQGIKTCKEVLDTMAKDLQNGQFVSRDGDAVDTPLWFFWTLQQYEEFTGNRAEVWKDYKNEMKSILEALRNGKIPFARMHDNGLIWAEQAHTPLTWMNAVIDGEPVTPRAGYQVEVNALWYNAVCYALELATEFKDAKFVKEWKDIPALIVESYKPVFWNEEKHYLADYVGAEGQNTFMRPNQIFATSLKYSPISENKRKLVLDAVAKELLTLKGIRTLAPQNPLYEGRSEGNQTSRDRAHFQGAAYPWLFGHYIEGNLKLYGKGYIARAKWTLEQLEEDITDRGINSISEVYNGDPPHKQRGSISQAWCVGEILRSIYLIEKYEK